jgi:hypothetical protein
VLAIGLDLQGLFPSCVIVQRSLKRLSATSKLIESVIPHTLKPGPVLIGARLPAAPSARLSAVVRRRATVFGLAVVGPQDESHYWCGGESWIAAPEEAVLFYDEIYAETTIDVLKRAFPNLSSTIHVVSLLPSLPD